MNAHIFFLFFFLLRGHTTTSASSQLHASNIYIEVSQPVNGLCGHSASLRWCARTSHSYLLTPSKMYDAQMHNAQQKQKVERETKR